MSTDPKLTSKPLRVLLVEDNADDAFLLERHLRRAGFQPHLLRVDTGEGLRQALESGDSGRQADGWDVVLADYHLPAFSAPEALKMVRQRSADLPFIVLSGMVNEETAVAAMRAGAHDYVSKQNLARLVPAIEREVGDAQARRQKAETEIALRSSERRFQHLADAAPLGLLIGDRTGRLLYANRAVERLLNCPQGELLSGSSALKDILHEAAQSLSHARDAQPQMPEAMAMPFESHCARHDGAFIPLLVAATILNPEAPVSEQQMAAFLVDLTEQRRSQEAVRRTEKLAATGRLAASIAHEINNPLEAVTNCLYLMRQTELNDTALHYLEMAQQELDRVIHISTQTLRFYRQNTRPQQTDVHELLETVVALYERRMRSLGIECTCEFPALPRITVYDGEIRQIFSNLIGNAVDAMQLSGGRLTLRTAQARDWKQDREGIAITVADNGTGIDRRTMKRIFEPFFSTKGTTGTGLGLWVSREILAKHQGTIHVRSHVPRHDGGSDGWTVFRVFLPFSLEPQENAAATSDAGIAEPDETSETARDLTAEGATEGAIP